MKWQLTGIKKLTENVACQQENVIESQPFLIEDCGLQMMAKLKLFESGPVLLLGFVQDNSPEKKIYYHRRTTILMDQSGIDPPKDRIRISEPHFGKDEAEEWMTTFVGCRLLDSFTTLKNKNNLYVKDDSVIIKILIHPLSILYQSYASDNGILLWKIEDFAKKKRDEKDEVTTCHMSDYFYSSKNGYRLQAQLHLHTRYLMIMVNFLRGEWDEFLPKFFPHKTTVTLLDQSNAIDKVDFEKSLLRNDTCNDTFNKYYLKDKLAESIYLKNDCLLVKVAIQPMCALSSSSELEYPQDSTSSSRLQDSAFFR